MINTHPRKLSLSILSLVNISNIPPTPEEMNPTLNKRRSIAIPLECYQYWVATTLKKIANIPNMIPGVFRESFDVMNIIIKVISDITNAVISLWVSSKSFITYSLSKNIKGYILSIRHVVVIEDQYKDAIISE